MDELLRMGLRALGGSHLGGEAAALEQEIARNPRVYRELWQESEEVLERRRELARQLRELRRHIRRLPPDAPASPRAAQGLHVHLGPGTAVWVMGGAARGPV